MLREGATVNVRPVARHMRAKSPMVGRLSPRRVGLVAIAVWLSVAPQVTMAMSGCGPCESAAGHHCEDVPSIRCCCVAGTAAAIEPAIRSAAQDVCVRETEADAMWSMPDDIAGACTRRARIRLGRFRSSACPPINRPILHSALLL